MSGSTLSNNVITVQTVKQKSKKNPNKILRLVNILIALRAIYE